MARFYLAVARRRCRLNDDAIPHLKILSNLGQEADIRLATGSNLLRSVRRSPRSSVVRHFEQYPESAFVILSYYAMALPKTYDLQKMSDALEKLDCLLSASSDDPADWQKAIYPRSAAKLWQLCSPEISGACQTGQVANWAA